MYLKWVQTNIIKNYKCLGNLHFLLLILGRAFDNPLYSNNPYFIRGQIIKIRIIIQIRVSIMNTMYFITLQKKVMLLLTASKPKLIDCTVHNQCLNILENCDFSQFWSKMVQFSISQKTLRADFTVKNQPNFAQKMSKEELWTGLRHFLTVGI